MGLTVYDVEIPTNLDSLEVFGTDVDDLTVFGTLVWQKQKYYFIAFASNGGTGSMPRQTMPVGVATALSANLFARTGYLFYGWSPSASGSRKYTDGQKVTDIAAAGETATLYALWDAITYYIRFNANGGSGSMGNQQFTYDAAAKLRPNAFSRTGYLFAGWQGAVAGATMDFSENQEVINLSSENGEIINLYALWTAITWYVRYHANGGSGSMGNSTHKYDTAKALTANAFTKLDSNFSGWATSADGAAVYTDGQSVKNLRSAHGDVLNLYAVWTRIPAEPFYLHEQNPTYTTTIEYGDNVQFLNPRSDFPYWQIIVTQGGGGEWTRATSTTSAINRRHCTKCKFTVYSLSGSSSFIQIGNTHYEITETGGTANSGGGRDHVVDISGEAETVQVTLGNQTGGSDSSIQISTPYFY